MSPEHKYDILLATYDKRRIEQSDTGGGLPSAMSAGKMAIGASSQTTTHSKRNAGVELYRCLLMFGIVMIHTIGFSSLDERPMFVWRLLRFCVDGFVIISGWYGIRFSLSKVVALWACGLWATLVSLIGFSWFGDTQLLSFFDHCKWFIKTFKSFWFLHAYVFMMFLTPLVNCVFEKCNNKELWRYLLPYFVLTFVWAFAAGFPLVGRLVPQPAGMAQHAFLCLLTCYVVGRMARRYSIDRFFSNKRLLLWVPALLVLPLCGFCEYPSPFNMAIGLAFLFLFMRLRVKGRLIFLLAPSMFSVYLLHTNGFGISVLQNIELFFSSHGYPYALIFPLTAIIIFVGCLILDAPRRLFVRILKRLLGNFLQSVDGLYAKGLAFLERI